MSGRLQWRQLASLALVPLLLIGPILLNGELFLPQLPTALEPYRSEDGPRAERALEDQNYTQSDRLFPFLTDQIAARNALRAGSWPSWEPNLGLGVPLFGGSLAGLGYPPNLLAMAMPPERAAAPLAMLSLGLAGLGALLFLRRLGLATGVALFGALAYQLGGWGVANLYYFMKVDAALWFPFVLWSVEGLARGRRHAGLALTLSVAGSLLAGMLTVGAFVLAAGGLYALWRLRLSGALLRAGAFTLLGLGVSLVWVWPALEASGESMRQEASPEVLWAESLPPCTSLGLVIPNLFGTPTEATPSGQLPVAAWLTPSERHAAVESANQLEWNTYAGLVVCVLALVGLVCDPRRAWWPALLLVLVLGFAQGWPLLRLAYHLPGLNAGHPARILALAWFLWPWLATVGLLALVERRPRSMLTLTVGAAAALALGLLLGQRVGDGERFADQLEATLVERYGEFQSADDVRLRLPRELSVASGERLVRSARQLALVAAALLLAALLQRWLHRRPAWQRTAPLLLLLVVEGRWAANGHLTGRPAEGELFPPSPALSAVRDAAGDGRVLRLDTSADGLADVHGLARPNMLQPLGIADLTPWVVFVPRTYNELFASFDPDSRVRQGVSRLSRPDLLGHPVLDRLNVRAILSRAPLTHDALEPRFERPGFHVYRRTTGRADLGPARLVPGALLATDDTAALQLLAGGGIDPAAHVVIAPEHAELARPHAPADPSSDLHIVAFERPTPDRVRVHVDVDSASGAWLVLHQQHYPGWSARVNGEPVPILRADHALQAMHVGAGTSLVELDYRPRSLRLGLLLSALSLLGAAALSWRTGRPPRAPSDSDAPAGPRQR